MRFVAGHGVDGDAVAAFDGRHGLRQRVEIAPLAGGRTGFDVMFGHRLPPQKQPERGLNVYNLAQANNRRENAVKQKVCAYLYVI